MELADRIKELADRRGIDVSTVVDTALNQYLKRAPIEDEWWEELVRHDNAADEARSQEARSGSGRKTSVKKAISLPEDVLEDIDAVARRRHRSRSAVILAAVEAYLERIDAEAFLQSLNDAYGDEPLDPDESGFLTRAARDLARIMDEEDGPWPAD